MLAFAFFLMSACLPWLQKTYHFLLEHQWASNFRCRTRPREGSGLSERRPADDCSWRCSGRVLPFQMFLELYKPSRAGHCRTPSPCKDAKIGPGFQGSRPEAGSSNKHSRFHLAAVEGPPRSTEQGAACACVSSVDLAVQCSAFYGSTVWT